MSSLVVRVLVKLTGNVLGILGTQYYSTVSWYISMDPCIYFYSVYLCGGNDIAWQ